DAALLRLDADLDEALVKRRHVRVEGSRQPLGRGRPTPEAPRPPPSRPFPSRCRGLDLRDDRRSARVVRPPGGRTPLRPGRRGPERPRPRPSPASRDRGGPAAGRNPRAPRKKTPRLWTAAGGSRISIQGAPSDVRSGGKWRPGTTPARPGG